METDDEEYGELSDNNSASEDGSFDELESAMDWYDYYDDGGSSEKAMATHSSTLAWKIPWMEEPGGLQSMGSLRVGHD